MPVLPADLLNYIANYSYLILIFIIIQGSLLVILFYFFIEKIASSGKVRRENELIKQEAYLKALKILEEARDTSLGALNEASKKAQSLIADSQLMTDDIKGDLHKQLVSLSDSHINKLSETTQTFIDSYKQALGSASEATINSLEKTSSIVQDELMTEVSAFKEVLRQETYKAEEDSRLKIKDEYNAVRDEIEAYKKRVMERTNANIYEIISQVTSNTVNRLLDLDGHQQVVMEFLEEAKRENRL